ncbi:MAG: LysR family transcriptional regulator [Desulfitobacteriaceae bacterium]|nr:LysR family transcriptional regulator [Desulfitobacteriaceae bacterium]MDD4753171.1 LysR family transcriptional regulator [Desulfitobacteriaceae bacterium]
MNIENVISFIYVYRLNNFQRAAEALYITQPSLTSRIKSLEKSLNATLLIRNKKGVELTEKGKIFLPYAFQFFDTYIKAQNSLRQSEESLTIGSIISASTSILPNALYQFQQRNPHLSIKVITAKTATMLEKLLNKECQFAITEKTEHPDIICEPIYEDPISLFAHPSHYFVKRNRQIGIEEISLEPLICFNPTSQYWAAIEEHFHKSHLTPNVVFNIDSMEAAKSIIIKNKGICFLPELSLETDLSTGHVQKVPIYPPLNIKRELSLIYLKESTAPYLQEFKHIAYLTIKDLKV